MHNAGNSLGLSEQKGLGLSFDLAGKGVHFNSAKLGEIRVRFRDGEFYAETIKGKQSLSSSELESLKSWILNNSDKVKTALRNGMDTLGSMGKFSGTNARNLKQSGRDAKLLWRALRNGTCF